MPSKRRKHLLRKLGKKCWIVFAVHHKHILARAQPALHIRHRADRRPILAQLIHSDMLAQRLPNMLGGHPLAYHVGKISGHMEKAASADSRVMNKSDVADRRSNAGAENTQTRKSLLLQPAQTAARILDRLPIRLQGQSDIGPDELIRPFMSRRHATIVIGQAQAQNADANALQPLTQSSLPMPLRIPIRQYNNSRTRTPRVRTRPSPVCRPTVAAPCREKLRTHRIVFSTWGLNRTRKRENVFAVQSIVVCRRRAIPIRTVFDRGVRVLAKKAGRIRMIRRPADMLEPPSKRTD